MSGLGSWTGWWTAASDARQLFLPDGIAGRGIGRLPSIAHRVAQLGAALFSNTRDCERPGALPELQPSSRILVAPRPIEHFTLERLELLVVEHRIGDLGDLLGTTPRCLELGQLTA